MELFPKVEESLPAPPTYVLEGDLPEQSVKLYKINKPNLSPPPASIVSPRADSDNSRVTILSYEVELFRTPALTTCSFCQTQVTTEVTFQVGTFAWLMCLLFVVCGLILGCCMIPFFVNHFKDACHRCPRCQRVLHIQKRTWFK